MRILYAGSPEFSVPALQALIQHHEVVGLLCQPDKPTGRGKKVLPPPTKLEAQKHGIPVFQPHKLKDPDLLQDLQRLKADIFIVCAYGKIIPETLLYMCEHDAWNIHASILPRWRGAAPIERAILSGDEETGVGIMKMEKGLDTGPVLLERKVLIDQHETGPELTRRLAELGAQAMLDALSAIKEGPVNLTEQKEEGITYAHKINKEEYVIDFSKDSSEIIQRIKAFYPKASATCQNISFKILKAIQVPALDEKPGTILANGKEGLVIATGSGAISISVLQIAGKKPNTWQALKNGYEQLFCLGNSL